VLKQIEGSADLGASYATGNNPTSVTFSATGSYASDKNSVTASTTAQFNSNQTLRTPFVMSSTLNIPFWAAAGW
jgi:hypothetical protein